MDEPGEKGWPYAPHVIIFFSSAFIMVVELVAGRLIARHLGNSLYTWTSIIGVILAGMSIGNYVGGRLADRWRSERLLGPLFLSASLTCLSVVPLNQFFSDSSLLHDMLWPLRTFLTVLAIFVLPAFALGTISPVAAKMAVERGKTIGKSIGSVYAWGAVGSIAGTFLTGFWLISALGSKGVVLSVSLSLAVMAVVLGPLRVLAALEALVMASLLVVSQLPPGPTGRTENAFEALGLREDPTSLLCTDSNYQFITVAERISDVDPSRWVRMLQLDYLIHGYVDVNDAGHLEYHYERLYREVVRRFMDDKEIVSAFFIGGGSYTFPRWVLHEWPGSRIDVAEIDPLVVETNYKVLGLPRYTSIRSFPADARKVVDDLAVGARYDLIIGDAFNDLSVPFHLTTLEFNEKIARHIKPSGLYLVNLIDDWRFGRLLGAYVLTLKKTFNHVYVLCTKQEGVEEGRETFVIGASMRPITVSDWKPGHETDFPGSLLTEDNMKELAAKCSGRILTDDNAPVENLLEPVVRNRN
jgi:spermidine synthase